MVSKRQIPIAGLLLTIYGLNEYKEGPVAVMFTLHGRLQNMSAMEPINQALCSINENVDKDKCHLLVVSFDLPNHGHRLVHKLSNYGWEEGNHRNPHHAVDMWSAIHSTSNIVSELVDVLENYIFGPQQKYRVLVWGILGFSMGGHSAFLAAANDSRISIAIPIVGTADFLGLMKSRLAQYQFSEETYLPQSFCDLVTTRTSGLLNGLQDKKILIINGDDDQLVPARYNHQCAKQLRDTHSGREGRDWKFVVIPNVGHTWCQEMIDLSVEWTNRWLKNNNSHAKLRGIK